MTESYDPIQEIEALGRVYHRLVETPPGPPFYSVISQLLPRLLHRIGQNHQHMLESETSGMSLSDSHGSKKASLKELYDNIHAKYLDMLTHIMKRVRPDETCKVPCEAIVYLLVDRKLTYSVI
jgi:proteasome component ECM29